MRHFTIAHQVEAALVALLCGFSSQECLSAQSASGFRGPGGQGVAAAGQLPARFNQRHVRWRVPVGGKGHSSPVVWKKRIYLTRMLGDTAPDKKATGRREVVCFDFENGKELWSKAFAFTRHRQHRFNSFASSTAAVDATGVFVIWTNGKRLEAVAVDHKGKVMWRSRVGEYFAGHGSGSSPTLAGDTLLVANENEGPSSALYGLDKKTGVITWALRRKSLPRRGSFATPLLVEQNGRASFALFASTSHGLTAVNPENGRVLWEVNPEFRQRFVATPVVGAGHLLAFAGSGGGGKESVLLRLPTKAGEKPSEVARPRRALPYVPCALPIGDRFYLINDAGIASCREAKTGEVVWRERLEGTFFGSPVSNGESVYVISREGKLLSFAVGDQFALHGSFDLGAGSYTTPAISENSLIVRTEAELLRLCNPVRTKPAKSDGKNSAPEKNEAAAKVGQGAATGRAELRGAQRYPELETVATASKRVRGAKHDDWPCFLGARRDSRSLETGLARKWPRDGPRLLWAMRRGEGYASPVIASGRLVYVHRTDQTMHVDCLEPETGLRHWRFSYPCDYRQGKYIRNKGQRSTAVIADGRVFVHGVGGMLHCLKLEDGEELWKRNLAKDYSIDDDYFGVVSSPLVHGDLLIQNLGGDKGHSVAAFDVKSGELRWGTGKGWGASCSSPVLGRVHGRERVFVLAPGFLPAELANTVLGGSFTSRLNGRLRDDEGLTYGAYSYFVHRTGSSYWVATLGVNPANLEQALASTQEELKKIHDSGVETGEYEKAREYDAGSFPMGLQSKDAVARQLLYAERYGLGMDYIAEHSEHIRALSYRGCRRRSPYAAVARTRRDRGRRHLRRHGTVRRRRHRDEDPQRRRLTPDSARLDGAIHSTARAKRNSICGRARQHRAMRDSYLSSPSLSAHHLHRTHHPDRARRQRRPKSITRLCAACAPKPSCNMSGFLADSSRLGRGNGMEALQPVIEDLEARMEAIGLKPAGEDGSFRIPYGAVDGVRVEKIIGLRDLARGYAYNKRLHPHRDVHQWPRNRTAWPSPATASPPPNSATTTSRAST